MADFHQNGNIATLHNLRTRSLDEMTYELETFAQTRKMALILPCLYSELETEAMPRILAELSKVTYLHRIIIVVRLTSHLRQQERREKDEQHHLDQECHQAQKN